MFSKINKLAIKSTFLCFIIIVSLGTTPTITHAQTAELSLGQRIALLQQIQTLLAVVQQLQAQLEVVRKREAGSLDIIQEDPTLLKDKKYLSSLRTHAELFYDDNRSYQGFCTSNRFFDTTSLMTRSTSCVDSYYDYRVAFKVSSSTYWCADSTGRFENVSNIDANTYACASDVKSNIDTPKALVPQSSVWQISDVSNTKVDLTLKHINTTAFRLTGTLFPPTKCRVGEFIYQLSFDGGETKTYNFDSCSSKEINEVLIFNPMYQKLSLWLTLRYVDRQNNVWVNFELKRYIVDLTTLPNPEVTDVTGLGQKG